MNNDNWQRNLDDSINKKNLDEWENKVQPTQQVERITSFFADVVQPAFESLKASFEKRGRDVKFRVSEDELIGTFRIWNGSTEEFNYTIVVEEPFAAKLEFVCHDGQKGSGILIGDEVGDEKISAVSAKDVIDSVIECYKQSDN